MVSAVIRTVALCVNSADSHLSKSAKGEGRISVKVIQSKIQKWASLRINDQRGASIKTRDCELPRFSFLFRQFLPGR